MKAIITQQPPLLLSPLSFLIRQPYQTALGETRTCVCVCVYASTPLHVFVLQNGIFQMRFIGFKKPITLRTQSNGKHCKVDSDHNNPVHYRQDHAERRVRCIVTR